jgi:heavy metal sensor kinase
LYGFFVPPRRPNFKSKSSEVQSFKPPPKPAMIDNPVPQFYIQYAIDTKASDAALNEFANQRDARLHEVSSETAQALTHLRQRLLWIGLATFIALVAGGWFLVWLGLEPLARLSEAVSQVTAKDFRLKIDEKKLPAELQPIAARLGETLEQLHQAFAREKQAATDISHELRTPVAALLATLDVGLRKPRSAEEYRELLQDCKLSGEHMAALVERLLALARLDAGADQLRPRRIDLADLVHQCADLVRPLAEAKGIDLRVNVPSGLVFDADPDKWREILTNLLHNAVEYNKPHGSIDLSLAKKAGRLLLEVRDTGVGIDPEARPHIFKRFFRADPSRHADTPHSGLGLAIVKSYVDLMNGTIVVDSSPAGSTFRIETPAA